MRILILGDSLPAPRPRHGVPLEKTWPALLRDRLAAADVWQRARPRSSSIDVLGEFKLFTESLSRFDILVVQTGIVDCVPRPYPRWLAKTIELCATFEQLRAIDRVAHRRFLWAYGRPWVSRRAFAANLGQLIAEARALHPGLKVLLVPIVEPTGRMLATFPRLASTTRAYNETLQRVGSEHAANAVVLDPFRDRDPRDLTLEDGHHLTTLGHELIAAQITATLSVPRQREAPVFSCTL